MGEYDRKQQKQESRAIANSGYRSRQLKGLVDNRNSCYGGNNLVNIDNDQLLYASLNNRSTILQLCSGWTATGVHYGDDDGLAEFKCTNNTTTPNYAIIHISKVEDGNHVNRNDHVKIQFANGVNKSIYRVFQDARVTGEMNDLALGDLETVKRIGKKSLDSFYSESKTPEFVPVRPIEVTPSRGPRLVVKLKSDSGS